jgi:hypothetical protein
MINACSVLESTSETIVCRVEYNSKLIPNLLYDVNVLVYLLGFAIPNDTFQFNLLSFVSSITPDIGKIFQAVHKTDDEHKLNSL